MRLQVRLLASLSGLKIWHCRGCGVGRQLQLRLDREGGVFSPLPAALSFNKDFVCLLPVCSWKSFFNCREQELGFRWSGGIIRGRKPTRQGFLFLLSYPQPLV